MASPLLPSDPAIWRKNGHQLKDVPVAVQVHVRIQVTMSPLIRGLYLPHPKLSVLNLAKFSLPPMASSATEYKIPSGHSFFSEDATHSELDLLTNIKVPHMGLIAQLVSESRQRYLDGAESISIPWTGERFPLWVVDLWSTFQLIVKPQVDAWASGIKWLMKLDSEHHNEVKNTLRSLNTLAWTGNIPLEQMAGHPHSVGDPVDSLSLYLSRKWLSSRQIDQMVDLILYDINKAAPARRIQGMTTIITTAILGEYSKSPRDYNPDDNHYLQRFGRSLEDGAEFGGVFHVNENHWVGATVDIIGQAIEYADPGGGSVEDVDVCAALQWFAAQHLPSTVGTLVPLKLSCTQQLDTYNCGLYAPNAIAHKFLPHEYELFGADLELGDLGRLEMLRRIIAKFHGSRGTSVKAEPSIITQKMHEYINTSPSESYSRSPSPSTPPADEDRLSNALRALSVSPRKQPTKRRKVLDSDARSSPPPIAPLFKQVTVAACKMAVKKTAGKIEAQAKKVLKKPAASARVKKEKKIAALKEHEERALQAMPEDVSDQDSEEDQSMAGRPQSKVMNQLTVEIKSNTSVRRYRCAGIGCIKIYMPRTHTRVFAHSKRCLKLTSEQRQLASKCSADTSPGARAEELSKGLSATDLELATPSREPVEFFGYSLPPGFLLDSQITPSTKTSSVLLLLWDPRYVPAGRTILMDNHVMSEQERVRALQIKFLKTQTRLSVSTDGGDVRCGENFYSVHATTAEGRSFLLEGFECTNVSHTAEWITDMVMEAIRPIGPERFIAASSDNTGNTRGFRRNICERLVTMLNLADPNHHLNNTLKDICLIPYFKLTIKILRGAIRHFNQSKQSKAMLKQLRMDDSIGRGLETIGKTRFATLTWSAISLRRNLGPVSYLCTNGQVEIKKYNSYFIKDTAKFLDFQMKLNQVISVTEGAAKAIQCLEAASCNPADVYLLWLAVTAHVRAALASSMLPESVCNEIRGIINHRWNEFFVTNPGHEAYLATFYLNPKYVNSTIFKRPNAVAPVTITIPGKTPDVPIGIRNAKTFTAVGSYLFKQGVLEVEHGIDPVLVAYKKKGRSFSAKFKAQFTAFAQSAFPFNTPLGNQHPIIWWRALEGSEHGGIIAALALKFYSAIPHSMADERTVSVITWMNPALRNLEKVNTIFSFAQIRGYYKDVAKQQALLDGTNKTRASARPHPEVKFYNIEREIHTVDDEEEDDDEDMDADDLDSDDEFDVVACVGADPDVPGAAAKIDWLDLPREIFAPSDRLDLEFEEVDLDSGLLEDILAEGPASRSVAESEGPNEHREMRYLHREHDHACAGTVHAVLHSWIAALCPAWRSSALASRPPPSRVSASSSITVPLGRPPARKFDYTSEAFEAWLDSTFLGVLPSRVAAPPCWRAQSPVVPASLCRWVSPVRAYTRYLQRAYILHPHLLHTVYIYMVCPRFPASPRAPFAPSFSLPYLSIRSYSPHTLLDPSAIQLSPPPAALTARHMPLCALASFQSNPARDARAPTHLLTKPYVARTRPARHTHVPKAILKLERRQVLHPASPQSRCLSPRVDNDPRCVAAVGGGVQFDLSSVHAGMCILRYMRAVPTRAVGEGTRGQDRTFGDQTCRLKVVRTARHIAFGGQA
ncbi:hypothetical protein C8R44DRAFT_896418 [Mycena epipterygia]|nr:hypothetical protein C8R44DRAFT_896418 [Mycena epipterygia]